MKPNFLVVLLCFTAISLHAQQYKCPATKKVEVVDIYFRKEVKDRDRWLEQIKDEEGTKSDNKGILSKVLKKRLSKKRLFLCQSGW